MPLPTRKDLSRGVPAPVRRWVTDQIKIAEKRIIAYIDKRIEEVEK